MDVETARKKRKKIPRQEEDPRHITQLSHLGVWRIVIHMCAQAREDARLLGIAKYAEPEIAEKAGAKYNHSTTDRFDRREETNKLLDWIWGQQYEQILEALEEDEEKFRVELEQLMGVKYR